MIFNHQYWIEVEGKLVDKIEQVTCQACKKPIGTRAQIIQVICVTQYSNHKFSLMPTIYHKRCRK